MPGLIPASALVATDRMGLQLLPTDLLFLGALTLGVVCGRSAYRDPLARARWARVLRSPGGGIACLVLGVYLAVAVLDSVRIERAQQAPLTVLDLVLTPLRTGVETTYSAPFATHAHARENLERAPGIWVRDYPPLQYGGRHLARPEEAAGDLGQRIALGSAIGLGVLALLTLAINQLRGRSLRGAITQWREPAWRCHWSALGVLCLGITTVGCLADGWHVLGTDKVGQDVLYLSLKSVRTGLVLAVLASLITLPIALVLGVLAGYRGGWVDDVIQYLYTTLSSIPGVLLIAAAALSLDLFLSREAGALHSLALRADLRLLALCAVLGLTGWTSLCRLLRAETMKLRTIEFVASARALGSPSGALLRRHLLPNLMPLVIITTVLDFSSLVLAEAVLTYIDIGVDPSTESWGNLINGARLELAREPVIWWSLASALGGMFGLVLAANVFADTVRDAFDPRLGPDAKGAHGRA